MSEPLPPEVLLLRAVVAIACGAAIGYERDRHKRPAGLRTHILVSLAAATFMIVSTQFQFFQGYSEETLKMVDGSRIASQVVSGAGFLVGGAILRSGLTVHGMTTAAGLWLVTGIGLAAGSGMFVEASVVTGLGMFALWGLRRIEAKGTQRVRGVIALELDTPRPLNEVVLAVEQTGAKVTSHSYRRRYRDAPCVQITLVVRHAEAFNSDELVRALEALEGMRAVRVQRAG
ncbi:MAG: MgtC/SapB family protein [Polyangiales bacterium]